jgi:hypothetical protein
LALRREGFQLRRTDGCGGPLMENIPILKIGNLLLVSIQVDLQDQLALALQDDLSERIVATVHVAY